MDHDAGWFAREITLITHPIDEHRRRLTLPCHWVEYVQTWDGEGSGLPYFRVSADSTVGLADEKWHILTFVDAGGSQHQHVVDDVKEIRPNVIQLTKLS
jgi:hypothetical protein